MPFPSTGESRKWYASGLRWHEAKNATMSDEGPAPRGKVARLLQKYEIEEFGEYLVEKWTADTSSERRSLRTLAREFNIRLLEAYLVEAGSQPVRGEAENFYDGLQGDSVSRGEKTQTRRTLEQRGIDVEKLESEFVSRQAIHTYLTKERAVSQGGAQSGASPSSARQTIDRLRERTRQVTTSKITRLREAGSIIIGDFRVIVEVQVYCSDCGAQLDVTELLTEGQCNCEQ